MTIVFEIDSRKRASDMFISYRPRQYLGLTVLTFEYRVGCARVPAGSAAVMALLARRPLLRQQGRAAGQH